MITKPMIESFYKDVDELQLKFPVAAISQATNESKSNVSKILGKKMEPSESFLNRFYEQFPKRGKIVSQDTVSERNRPGASGEDLSTLIKSNADLVETIKKCQEDQRELIALLKANLNPAAKEASEAIINETMVEYVLRIAVHSGMIPTVEAGRKELGKMVVANAEKHKKRVSTVG